MNDERRRETHLAEDDFQSIPAEEIGNISGDILPVVSVLMITFNHEAHIAEAIESILGQHCEFPFELIIGEDCSHDSTREICLAYQKRYPGIVRVVFADENVGMHRNFARIWHRARGQYVAMCEGDDYWTDEYKLDKQVALLEKKPNLTMCGALTEKILQAQEGSWMRCGIVGPVEIKEEYGLEDLIPDYTFHFSSIMVRKDIVQYPVWFWDVYCVDRPLYLFCAENGPAGFLPEVMSVYRLHDGGIWSPSDNLGKASKGVKLFENIDRHFAGRYRMLIRQTLGNIIWSYMAVSLEAGDRTSARELFWMSIHYRCAGLDFSAVRLQLVVFMRLYFPSTFRRMRNTLR